MKKYYREAITSASIRNGGVTSDLPSEVPTYPKAKDISKDQQKRFKNWTPVEDKEEPIDKNRIANKKDRFKGWSPPERPEPYDKERYQVWADKFWTKMNKLDTDLNYDKDDIKKDTGKVEKKKENKLKRYKPFFENKISYSKVLSNLDIIKNKELLNKVKKLDWPNIKGGFGAIWNYPKENISRIVITYDKKEPIGVISDTNGDQNIWVEPKYRKQGIGSKLKDILYKRKRVI